MFYIFDYGATIDTPGNHWGKVIWHAYERVGVPVVEAVYREAYVYAERYLGSHQTILPTDGFRTTLSKKLRLQLDHLGLFSDRLHTTLLDDLYSRTEANVAASKTVLQTLKQQGHSLALVSNFYGNLPAVLREFGLEELFSVVVESATEGIRKPDPRLLSLCMERLGAVAAETIVVGDHLTKDIQPAQSLGCHTVWIKGEPWSSEHDAASGVMPEHTVTSLQEILELQHLLTEY